MSSCLRAYLLRGVTFGLRFFHLLYLFLNPCAHFLVQFINKNLFYYSLLPFFLVSILSVCYEVRFGLR